MAIILYLELIIMIFSSSILDDKILVLICVYICFYSKPAVLSGSDFFASTIINPSDNTSFIGLYIQLPYKNLIITIFFLVNHILFENLLVIFQLDSIYFESLVLKIILK